MSNEYPAKVNIDQYVQQFQAKTTYIYNRNQAINNMYKYNGRTKNHISNVIF